MVISHNLTAMNAQRQFNLVNTSRAKSTEKLSSGYKINRAADDAAGLAISEKLRRQIRGLNQGAENIQDGISYVQVADGALNEVHDIMHRINELAVKSSNGTNNVEDRYYIDQEVQQLKKELNRIFETTSFNEQKIWGHGPIAKYLGDDVQITSNTYPAVTYNSFNSTSIIDNNNRGAVPMSGVSLNATDAGLTFYWTGYDGKTYKTNNIPWGDKLSGSHQIKISDHMDYDTYPNARGIDFTYSYTVNSISKLSDVKTALNSYYSYPSSTISVPVYPTNSYADNSMQRIGSSVSINYDAQLVSGKSFTDYDTAFIEFESMVNPANASVSDSTPFSFKFQMAGIGTVKATVYSATYTGNYNSSMSDRTGENIWWREATRSNGTKYKSTIGYSGDGSLTAILDSINNTNGHSLWTDNPSGGSYSINFQLTADTPYTTMSGGRTSSVGSMTLSFSISKSSASSQAGLANYITGVLNNLTGIDIYDTDNSSKSTLRVYRNRSNESNNTVTETIIKRTPLYEYDDKFKRDIRIQAGPEPDDGIHIIYDNLNNGILGIEDLNVKTIEDSADAIDKIKDAMQIISAQRSDFGSYQNRLEHSYNNNLNVAENTTDAESRIRDTDMAEEMVTYSLKSILSQAGQAMMAQANQANQGVLSLLS